MLPEERTVIEKAGRLALLLPSLTEITMLLNVPTLLEDGVPVRRPFAVLKLAQLGRFLIENPSEFPSRSLAVGLKEYAEPAFTLVAGVPVIVGARFEVVDEEDEPTWIENEGNTTSARPSRTWILMLL